MTDIETAKRHFYDAVALLDAGDFHGGAARLREALKYAPDSISILINLAGALMLQGSLAESREVAERILALDPRNLDALRVIAECLAREGRHAELVPVLDAIVALEPGAAEPFSDRSAALNRVGRHDDALASADRAIALKPGLAAAHVNRGNSLAALRRGDEALAAYERATALDPRLAEPWRGCAMLHAAAGRHADALAAYDRVLGLDPSDVEAAMARANLLTLLQRADDAVAAYDHALAIAPQRAEAWYGRGIALGMLRRYEEAVAAYDRALALDPKLDYAAGNRLAALMMLCDWTRYDAARADVLAAVRRGERAIAPFDMIAIATAAADQLACGRIYVAHKCPPVATAPVPKTPRRDDKINIAYLSADFRYHPVAMLTAGLFEAHDRARFRTTAIAFGPDEDTAMRRRLKAGFDSFVDADRLGDAAVADLLRGRDIDIAIDLMGITSGGRPGIFARRAAPIQVNYLGLPATMGADYIDYIIADAYVVPAACEPHYAERIVRLPDTFQVNDARRPLPPRVPARGEHGLPEDGLVLCGFNSLAKITPELFDVWMRLLARTGDAVLWLLSEGDVTERNLRREAAARGIAPDRLRFAPRAPYAEYLARYRAADLFLDTFPFNGGTTVSDTLWMGLPVVTLSGETFGSRMAGSLLGAAGLAELATSSLAAYEELALALCRDRARLAALRAALLAGHDALPLFDTARFCRHLEAAFVTMHERHRRDEPPASFSVASIAAG